ncbi:MAG: CRISPR-associated endonuclease Cas3'' [Chitinispirillaceae bacterium]|nr:CRISPR-associated endonuclease Cas3'' [Chitinispirillaceae bacterium]
MTNKHIAHVKLKPEGTWNEPHLLSDHLFGTAELASAFVGVFSSAKWGKLLGLMHDSGKSTERWQEYLNKKSGYGQADAHLEGKPNTVDHSTPSAKLAEELLGKCPGRFLAYCIAGHHAGLPNWSNEGPHGQSSLSYRFSKTDTSGISEEVKIIAKTERPGGFPWAFDGKCLDLPLWIRMLFSCLVDADYLDTEKYMEIEKSNKRGDYLTLKELLPFFNTHMAEVTQNAQKTNVNELRNGILSDCRKAAKMQPGIFSLTVPTGGGKTLSSLAFALEHAVTFGMDRVIYVIPYTSILEQNADVFRKALGDEQVVEHHSNIDEDGSTIKSCLAAENWDAPIIVTTSVQFFESLFAAKPGRCRKLHNIANSVVVLDEAQLIPVEYLYPVIQTIDLLQRNYNVTFVISTATQPALECRVDFKEFKGLPPGSIREIISDVPKLYRELKRVDVELPTDYQTARTLDDIKNDLLRDPAVLCVVSDRKSCRDLYQLMPSGTYHLSALMCGQHRSDIIEEIKQKLADGTPIRVISTQLVEAGVDLDFPVVYRALAGLDSIAQAAGRCNREGKLPIGRTVVFIPPKKSPPGILRKAAETTNTLFINGIADPLSHENFEKYFSRLYWSANSLDKYGIIELLKPDPDECGIQFRSAAEKFKIIDDTQQKSVLVPYGKGKELITILKKTGPERWLLRKLQRYTVNVYQNDFSALLLKGLISEITPGIFALETEASYDPDTGLAVDEIPFNPDKFIL